MLIAHAQLPTFLAVAELLNLSAAARTLGITQTGATQRIKSLEQSLGTTLFTRSTTGLDYLRTFQLQDHVKRSRFCVSENVTLIRLLELGLGVGVLPKEIAEPLIQEGKLVALNQGRTHKIPFALAWYPRKEMPDYFREIIRLVK